MLASGEGASAWAVIGARVWVEVVVVEAVITVSGAAMTSKPLTLNLQSIEFSDELVIVWYGDRFCEPYETGDDSLTVMIV